MTVGVKRETISVKTHGQNNTMINVSWLLEGKFHISHLCIPRAMHGHWRLGQVQSG